MRSLAAPRRAFIGGLVAVTTAVACLPGIAAAQDEESGALQEIVVTAQKRSENAQDVPIAINVLTGDELATRGVDNVTVLELATPGLVIGNVAGNFQPYIRGIGSDTTLFTAETPVATYLDGVYLPGIKNFALEFSDIQRIEVLKGPQGTLYGRNTTAGAINVITRDPTTEPSADVAATFGNLGQREFTGFVSGGSGDLSASLSAFSRQRDGITRNLVDGSDINDKDVWGVRGKVKYVPNDTWSFTLTGDFFKEDDTAAASASYVGPAYPALLGAQVVVNNPEDTYVNFVDQHKQQQWGGSLNVEGDFDAFNVVSITGFRGDSGHAGTDADASSLQLLAVPADTTDHSFSQEVRFLSPKGTGRLQWVGGLYYFKSKFSYDNIDIIQAPTDVPSSLAIQSQQSTDAYAAFGQATYDLTEQFRVTAGLRYNHEKKTLDELTLLIPSFGITSPTPKESKSWNNTSPKLSFEYHVNDQLLYVTASKGFRSGQYNTASPGAAGPVNPEKLTAVEIGGKHEVIDNRLRVNWSVFHYKYKDLQVAVIDVAGGGVTSNQNAATSKVKGADLDVVAALARGLQISVGAEYLDSTYDRYENAQGFAYFPTPGTYQNVSFDASGNRTSRSPKVTLTTSLAYSVPMPGGSLSLSGTYYHNSGFYLDASNFVQQDAYDIANFRATYELERSKIGITAYVKNAFDKRYITGMSEIAPFGPQALFNDPRLYGVSLSWKY